jgi:hypothetical protein
MRVHPGHLVEEDDFLVSNRGAVDEFLELIECFKPVFSYGEVVLAMFSQLGVESFQLIFVGDFVVPCVTETETVIEEALDEIGLSYPAATVDDEKAWLVGIEVLLEQLTFMFSAYKNTVAFVSCVDHTLLPA